jgi:hypothetical protein
LLGSSRHVTPNEGELRKELAADQVGREFGQCRAFMCAKSVSLRAGHVSASKLRVDQWTEMNGH